MTPRFTFKRASIGFTATTSCALTTKLPPESVPSSLWQVARMIARSWLTMTADGRLQQQQLWSTWMPKHVFVETNPIVTKVTNFFPTTNALIINEKTLSVKYKWHFCCYTSSTTASFIIMLVMMNKMSVFSLSSFMVNDKWPWLSVNHDQELW